MAAQVSYEDACVLEIPGDGQPSGEVALRYVAGLDISTDHGHVEIADPNTAEQAVACLIVCELPSMSVVYEDFEVLHHSVPYHSGFLGFREVPAYATLVARLRTRAHRSAAAAHSADAHFASTYDPHTSVAAITAVGVAGRASAVAAAAARPPWPQVFLVDGYGALHHRRCGSACHLGVHCGIPTVGVAKTLLHVDGLQERSVRAVLSAGLAAVAATSPSVHSAQLHPAPGACAAGPTVAAPGCSEEEAAGLNACGACVTVRSPRGEAVQSVDLVSEWTGEVLGVAVAGMHCTQKPIYVSAGHMVSLRTAVRATLACCVTRIPEPIRQADLRSRAYIRHLVQRHAAENPPRGAPAATTTAPQQQPHVAREQEAGTS